MHWLQRATLKTARAWRSNMGLREVFAHARSYKNAIDADTDRKRWISWARHSRLDTFKRLGATLKEHLEGVVRGMLDHCSNAFVEAMNGRPQQTKRAAQEFRTATQLPRHRLPALRQTQASTGLTVHPGHALGTGRTTHRA